MFKLWNNNVHHFCPTSDTQKTGTKSGIFQNQIPAEKQWFQSYKNTNCVKKTIFLVTHEFAISDLGFLRFWKMDALNKKTKFYSVSWNTLLTFFLKKGFGKEGFWTSDKKKNQKGD